MLELDKKNIHMTRWKNKVASQVTLDDDFIVPDTMSDVAQIVLDSGEIILEPVKVQKEKVTVRGKLDFHVLYGKEEGGLQTLGGMLPFEETINVPGLEEKDYVSVTWQLDDLNVDIINSRKLSVKGIVTLEVKVETLFDTELTSGVEVLEEDNASAPGLEVQKKNLEVASIAIRRKDTFRIKEELALSGSKPAIDHVLWTEMRLSGATSRPLDGKIHLEGTLLVFVLYEGEGEGDGIYWVEESVPFSGEVEMTGVVEEMIPSISLRLIHKQLEEKPDSDGEMRQLDIDAVIELGARLYEEQQLEILSDLYATNREVVTETEETCFDKLLVSSWNRCKIGEKLSIGEDVRVLQICHTTGNVKLDEVEIGDGVLAIDGILEVNLLYLTDNDTRPIQSVTEVIPFHYDVDVQGIQPDSIWYLDSTVEQLTAVMIGSGNIEVKAAIAFGLLVLEPVCQPVIKKAQMEPLDWKKLQQTPGIVGYLVQPEDCLWNIAKKFHTTVDNIIETNGLTSEQVKPGDSLILVKEISR